MITARAVTGCQGQRLYHGIDLRDLRAAGSGDEVSVWSIQTKNKKTMKLAQALSNDTYSLIAEEMFNRGVGLGQDVVLYNGKGVKEILFKERAIRIRSGSMYFKGFKE